MIARLPGWQKHNNWVLSNKIAVFYSMRAAFLFFIFCTLFSFPLFANNLALTNPETTDANATNDTINVEFDISIPQTVSSSAKPTVVDVKSSSVNATYEYAVAPKLDLDAFLLAKVTGWEDLNLLPGEANIFFEGTFVGKTFIDPNNIRDTLSVSMGRDKRIVVKREKVKNLSSRKVIGTSEKQESAWEITVRNTKSENVLVVVEDQIPVSQNNQIEVTVVDNGGAKQDTFSGKLTWKLNLKPAENKKLAYKFEVKYPKDRRISGL